MNPGFWRNKVVFITGHTGFKGGWLSLWLNAQGAKVHGYALPPATSPNFFTEAKVSQVLESNTIANIEDIATLRNSIQKVQPDIVLHLAAQALVRLSYDEPVITYATNVMGTVNLLETVRGIHSVKAIVNVTTDKCYENKEWLWPYREDESLGGYDPYSSSKACSELVTAAYRNSFLSKQGVRVATARAGNVIGGGDWSTDRLIPDFLRAMDNQQLLKIRSPNAIRPWQHVLEPLAGYLLLAEKLFDDGESYAQAWNFGPSEDDAKPVSWIVNRLTEAIPCAAWKTDSNPQPHEAGYLKLDSSKARNILGWKPRWNLDTSLQKIIDWHSYWKNGGDMQSFSLAQIADYLRA